MHSLVKFRRGIAVKCVWMGQYHSYWSHDWSAACVVAHSSHMITSHSSHMTMSHSSHMTMSHSSHMITSHSSHMTMSHSSHMTTSHSSHMTTSHSSHMITSHSSHMTTSHSSHMIISHSNTPPSLNVQIQRTCKHMADVKDCQKISGNVSCQEVSRISIKIVTALKDSSRACTVCTPLTYTTKKNM